MYHAVVSVVLCAAIVQAIDTIPTATPTVSVQPGTVGSILSRETARFIMFSDNGTISANGDFRKLISLTMRISESLANIIPTNFTEKIPQKHHSSRYPGGELENPAFLAED